MRQLIARPYELSRSTVGTIVGRVGRLLMHLEGSRPTKEGGNFCLQARFFDSHHADLSSGSYSQPAPVIIVREDDESVGLCWGDDYRPLVLAAHFRPLAIKPLFHLLYFGGPALELRNTTVATTFVGPDNQPAPLHTAWKEMLGAGNDWRFENLFENGAAKKRSGDRAEAYFTLAAIAASQMHGLSARPRLDEFVSELVAHLTGEREAAEPLVDDFARVFGTRQDMEDFAEVPFGSPSNTP
jgi:hypothetical protein